VFDDLASLGATPVGGLPADLVALEARCSLLEKLGRRADLEREARVLYAGLANGRWPLLHASYDFKIGEARAWLGGTPDLVQWEERGALSAAAEALWAEWRQEPVVKGRRILTVDGRPVLAAWVSSTEELTALLAPPAVLRMALDEAGAFSARMIDADGRLLLGSPEPAGATRVERSPASTRASLTLQIAAPEDGSSGLADAGGCAGRSFVLLVGLLVAVSYLAARATTKELAVARLQADFISAVSHEFRTPLSSICQISELLDEDRWPSDEHRRRSFEILRRESARLRRLVEGLLDFARMEAGAAHYRLGRLPPGELVRSVAEEFQMQSASRRHDVRLAIAPGLPEIDADSEALGRAVWNLLDNAVKYSPESATVHADVTMEGGRVAIRIRDEGIGIPREEQEQIFRKFVRGRQATARGVKGTGIGLAMVRHIVEGHGGGIRVESEPAAALRSHPAAATEDR
jgi:two-component system phosphate regulon sensor histidine kinase PhoR